MQTIFRSFVIEFKRCQLVLRILFEVCLQREHILLTLFFLLLMFVSLSLSLIDRERDWGSLDVTTEEVGAPFQPIK